MLRNLALVLLGSWSATALAAEPPAAPVLIDAVASGAFTPSPPPAPVPAPTPAPAPSTTLFRERFEDGSFSGRSWYDNTKPVLSTAEKHEGSQSIEFRFTQGGSVPVGGSAMRHKFTDSDTVTIDFWVKHSANWVGSGKPFHPHLFSLITNQDTDFVGPSITHLTTYVEEVGGFAQLGIQDASNIDQNRIDQDLRSVTEQRAVAGCNGPQLEPVFSTSCYDYSNGNKTNVLEWRSAAQSFTDSGAQSKTEWHRVQATFQMNSIANGKAVADGVVRYALDGQLVIERTKVIFRTGANAGMKFNQLVLAPFIGDGSPVEQTLWFDDLIVSTTPVVALPNPTPAPPATTPPPPPPPVPPSPPAPVPAGVLLQEGFEAGNKGSFDFDADGRTSYVNSNCHTGRFCGAKTLSSGSNQQRVFWEKAFKNRPTTSFYFSGWWRFPVGYTWDEASGTDPFGWEHKMLIVNLDGAGKGRVLLNLRDKGTSPEIAIHFESLESIGGISKRSGVRWPTDGQWHQLELQVDRSSNGRAQVFLDGRVVIDQRGATCGNPCENVAGVQVGAFVNQGARVQETFYMDDITIAPQRP